MMASEEKTPWPERKVTQLIDTKWVDVTVWDEFAPYIREGDIVVNCLPKSGTTWMVQVILQMLNNGEEILSAPDNTIHYEVPWIEDTLIQPKDTMLAKLKASPPDRPRIIKSHLKLDALLFSPKIRYVCVLRDGRDVAMSIYNHHMSSTEDYREAATGSKHVRYADFDSFFETWVLSEDRPFWTDYFHYHQMWFEHAKTCDKVLLINYDTMQLDLPGVVLKLARFLDIKVDENSESFRNILHHSSFAYMKQHEELFDLPSAVHKAGTFIHKGVSGRWQDVLSESQNQMYWDKITQCWPPELIEFVHKNPPRQVVASGDNLSHEEGV